MSFVEKLDDFSKKSFSEKIDYAVKSITLIYQAAINEGAPESEANSFTVAICRVLISAVCNYNNEIDYYQKKMIIDVMKKIFPRNQTDDEYCKTFIVSYNNDGRELLKDCVSSCPSLVPLMLILSYCFATASGGYTYRQIQILKDIFNINE